MGFHTEGLSWPLYVAQLDQAGSVNNQITTTFADIPGFSSKTLTGMTGPTRQYTIAVDVAIYCSALVGGGDVISYRLVIDSTNYTTNSSHTFCYAINQGFAAHFVFAATLTAASHTLKLQWKSNSNVTHMNTDGNGFLTYTVMG
jgi:hypothetical protein